MRFDVEGSGSVVLRLELSPSELLLLEEAAERVGDLEVEPTEAQRHVLKSLWLALPDLCVDGTLHRAGD